MTYSYERHNITLPSGLFKKAKDVLNPNERVSWIVAQLLSDFVDERSNPKK